jgi:hypothetical protein
MTEYDKAIEILDKLDFFYGQRAGRELWAMKPVDVQNEDIKSFVRDITFLKEFINKEAECGTWRLETDEEEPNPMFKLVVCSACNEKANTTYRYCPNCGVKMGGVKSDV